MARHEGRQVIEKFACPGAEDSFEDLAGVACVLAGLLNAFQCTDLTV